MNWTRLRSLLRGCGPGLPIRCGAWVLIIAAVSGVENAAPAAPPMRALVAAQVDAEYPNLFELYKHLHQYPELSFREEQSAARVAEELRRAECEVATGVGRRGVVGVLRNGSGPTVMVRSDMDGLPVREQTGLPYASAVTTKDAQGNEVPVMHACGHDVHMTCLVGTARVLRRLKASWHGTVVFIGQPAEEAGGGALAMLSDGLFTRFPRPDFCLALHDNAEIPAGTLGYTPGFAMANVDSVNILVRGLGGHGAYPHQTRDPVVLAARIVLALQTIVSREVEPIEPAVVTVGSIHGGTKHNIIPDDVKLQLTVRSYTDAVRQQILSGIKRICRGEALAAGIPEALLPEVEVQKDFTPATYNDPALTERIVGAFKAWFGADKVLLRKPSMGGEDFGEFGRTAEKIPVCMFAVGGVAPDAIKESQRTGKSLPSLHSSLWVPLPEPTIKTGVTAMTAAVLELTGADK